MNDHYDSLEARDPALREAQWMTRLPHQLANAMAHASAFTESLHGVDAKAVTSRRALAALPVTRKSELLQRQQTLRTSDVFGGFSTIGWGTLPAARRALRVFSSPGPIYEPEGAAPDYWRMARALFARHATSPAQAGRRRQTPRQPR